MLRSVTRWCVLGVIMCLASASAVDAQLAVGPAVQTVRQVAAGAEGELYGTIQDDRGQPLVGAVVSAVGSTSVFAVSDREGRFAFRSLPVGPYLIRVHLRGYLPARGRLVDVQSDTRNVFNVALARLAGSDDPPPVLAAGVGTAGSIETEAAAPSEPTHGHDEVAWRLRHVKRSVLKDAQSVIAVLQDDPSLFDRPLDRLSRAVGTPARLATSVLADLPPVDAQINLLTTTSFDRPQDLFLSSARGPRPVAFVSLAAPAASGLWTMRGTITQGDLASWIVAGSYLHQAESAHQYEAGLSYSTQQYLGGNAEALAAMRDGSRNVGAIHAYDTWAVMPRLSVSYGGKYARYDYLAEQGLVSPRAGIVVKPSARDSLRLKATVAHRETAPGAEEFLPPSTGLWLPPERTFSPLSRDVFRPERLDHVEVAAERQWPGDILVGVRAFRQRVADQMVTLFGVTVGDAPAGVGHYHVGSAGDFEAHGWGISVSRTVGDGIRTSVDYTQVDADWTTVGPDERALAALGGAVLRTAERIHDLTASLESLVSPTATRLFVVYKLNTGFAGDSAAEGRRPGARFDVQVNQALPFLNFTSGQWEMLVAVSNLFREDLLDSSVYDELLVVRPPKRVLGGVTVRF